MFKKGVNRCQVRPARSQVKNDHGNKRDQAMYSGFKQSKEQNKG